MSRHPISFCLSSKLAGHEQSAFLKMLTYPVKCTAVMMQTGSFRKSSDFLLVTCLCRHSGLAALPVMDVPTDCKCLEYLLNDLQGSRPPRSITVHFHRQEGKQRWQEGYSWGGRINPWNELKAGWLESSFAKKDLEVLVDKKLHMSQQCVLATKKANLLSICVNTQCGGVKKIDLDSSQWCPVTRTRGNVHKDKFL